MDSKQEKFIRDWLANLVGHLVGGCQDDKIRSVLEGCHQQRIVNLLFKERKYAQAYDDFLKEDKNYPKASLVLLEVIRPFVENEIERMKKNIYLPNGLGIRKDSPFLSKKRTSKYTPPRYTSPRPRSIFPSSPEEPRPFASENEDEEEGFTSRLAFTISEEHPVQEKPIQEKPIRIESERKIIGTKHKLRPEPQPQPQEDQEPQSQSQEDQEESPARGYVVHLTDDPFIDWRKHNKKAKEYADLQRKKKEEYLKEFAKNREKEKPIIDEGNTPDSNSPREWVPSREWVSSYWETAPLISRTDLDDDNDHSDDEFIKSLKFVKSTPEPEPEPDQPIPSEKSVYNDNAFVQALEEIKKGTGKSSQKSK